MFWLLMQLHNSFAISLSHRNDVLYNCKYRGSLLRPEKIPRFDVEGKMIGSGRSLSPYEAGTLFAIIIFGLDEEEGKDGHEYAVVSYMVVDV